MIYLIAFVEGLITFISPCLLPMLPLYLLYFAGQGTASSKPGTNSTLVIKDFSSKKEVPETNQRKTLFNALAFILGFTLVFVTMGAFAGTIGSFLRSKQKIVDIIAGLIIIAFGLDFMELLPFAIFKGGQSQRSVGELNVWSSFLFGLVFSIGWTPCVGVFLGSALILASKQGSVYKGILMLFSYSMGLGIPFLISALLVDRLKSTFQWIKDNYTPIRFASGLFLVLIGITMMFGWLGRLLTFLS